MCPTNKRRYLFHSLGRKRVAHTCELPKAHLSIQPPEFPPSFGFFPHPKFKVLWRNQFSFFSNYNRNQKNLPPRRETKAVKGNSGFRSAHACEGFPREEYFQSAGRKQKTQTENKLHFSHCLLQQHNTYLLAPCMTQGKQICEQACP